MGLSILAAAGLDELACDSEQAYVATCARLAADVQGRGAFRATIRDRLRVSALMDARGFASALEQRLLGALLALESGARPVPMRAVP
jgi:predicted O-linked N-acetylglucosamine transferase (SPINDLY family)